MPVRSPLPGCLLKHPALPQEWSHRLNTNCIDGHRNALSLLEQSNGNTQQANGPECLPMSITRWYKKYICKYIFRNHIELYPRRKLTGVNWLCLHHLRVLQHIFSVWCLLHYLIFRRQRPICFPWIFLFLCTSFARLLLFLILVPKKCLLLCSKPSTSNRAERWAQIRLTIFNWERRWLLVM